MILPRYEELNLVISLNLERGDEHLAIHMPQEKKKEKRKKRGEEIFLLTQRGMMYLATGQEGRW